MTTERFLTVAVRSLLAMLLIATVAVVVPKIWAFGQPGKPWQWGMAWSLGWGFGSAALGLAIAVFWTLWTRQTEMEAAIEIDKRFGLKERVSSTLALHEHERETEAGRALTDDAVRRVGRVEVGEKFRVPIRWWAGLPIAAAVAVFLLAWLVPDAMREPTTVAAAPATPIKQIKKSTDELKKKLAERQKRAREKGLADASDLFKKLEQGVDKLSEKDLADRKKAMVKLNDLAKDLEKRREQLAGSDKLRDQFNQLKDLKKGPADKMAKAIKNGDFKKALDELKNLKEKLEANQLTDEEREKLAGQLQQMQDKLNEVADAHEQAKQEIERQIAEKLKSGDMEGCNKLQQQLDRLNQQNEKMDRLRQMAQKLGECSNCTKEGNCSKAADQLSQLAGDLEQLQSELDELEMLDEVMDQLSQAKSSMNCKKCGGQGCGMCQGGGGQGDKPGMGMGEGQGVGARPEEENPTKHYDSRVGSKLGDGDAVVVDSMEGPNVAGTSRETIKVEVDSAKSASSDPLTGQRLPKDQREQARQYFDEFRKDGS